MDGTTAMPDHLVHDVVTVGASAGGVEAVGELLAGLPADLPASIFVAVHTHPSSGLLADVLSSRARLPVAHAVHGERIEHGRIYVAPADMHLIVRAGHVEVVRGPRENGHRPSIDVLFRTAARTYGPRVIGVVLTGYHDCGTAGLLSIKARGGIAVAQDPSDALVPDMPRSSIDHVAVDHVARLEAMPALLTRLVDTPAPATPPPAEEILELEGETPGIGTSLACPICSGALAETDLGNFEGFRCHIGHSFSLATLARMHEDEVERALWAAVRALEDGANLSTRLAGRAVGEMRERLADRGRVQSQDAQVIRNLLVGPKRP
jgi:two-component system chemotaxis response regulator CheB